MRRIAVAAAVAAATWSSVALAEEQPRPAEASGPATVRSREDASSAVAARIAAVPATGEADAGPAPAEAAPDPLTPPSADDSPVAAPGAPSKPSTAEPSAAPTDPIVLAVRAALAAWPEARNGVEKGHLAALGAHYAGAASAIWTSGEGLTARATAAIDALRRADDWGLDAAAFAVPGAPAANASPATLAETEIRLGLAVLLYARHARGGRTDPPSLSAMIDMRPRLYEPGSVLAAVAAAPAADVYLEGLHPRHPGFVALRGALVQARANAAGAGEATGNGRRSDTDVVRRIVANLERWRWLPEDLGTFHVWDNVPEQVTRVIHDGNPVLTERIVVGKPNTPTPIFSAPMRFVIFHPSWGVPEGIKSNEIGPMLRRAQGNASSGWFFSGNGDGASRALRRHDLRVYRGGREVDPDSVNWTSVDVRQFQFTQPPSNRNVLGLVKFRFPNKFDVYMHDTSERHLFSRSQRTFSHGCMRVQNPMRLAETILGYDKGWGREKVAALVARGTTTDVTLEKNVPVHIVYFTTTVDDTGKLHTHPDIYGVDGRVASALLGRGVSIASAAPKAEKEAAGASAAPEKRRNRQAARKAQSAQQSGGSGGGSFDPFSSLTAN
jgi:murein L,D-transpeptidase YcbB/YkuD